jgi:CheY-like chemotaxis protein
MSQPRKVLIADPDFVSIRALARGLRSRGFHVQAVPDGSKALEMAILRQPEIILFDQACQIIDAKNFQKILESNPRTNSIPVIVTATTREVTEPESTRDGILHKPLNLDEVVSRIDHLCRRAEAAKSLKGDVHEIEGALDQLPLADLMQILALNRRTGRLVLSGGMHKGEIHLLDGKPVNAKTSSVEGEKAFFRLVGLKDGSFAFKPQKISGSAKIQRGMEDALMEGMRQADETARFLESLPPLKSELMLRPDAVLPLDPLPVMREVLSLLAQPVRIDALLDRVGAIDLDVFGCLTTLLEKGLLQQFSGTETTQELILRPAELHALRAVIMKGTLQNVMVKKLIMLGSGTKAAQLFKEIPSAKSAGIEPPAVRSGFGTLGRVSLNDAFHLDFIMAPAAPAARPLWRPFLSNALGALVLETSDEIAEQARYCSTELHMPVLNVDPKATLLQSIRQLLLLVKDAHLQS